LRARLSQEAVDYAKSWDAPNTATRLADFYRQVTSRTPLVSALPGAEVRRTQAR
jgi:hypothetical protein